MALGKKTGGRKKGTPNKSTAQIKAAAAEHGEGAIRKLARLMETGETDQIQLNAAVALLDRAYGRPTQMLGSDEENPLPTIGVIRFVAPGNE